jgi:small subunit ribosomal protein S6
LTTATPEYELVLMLDPEVPDERRDQIASDARQRIESAGNLKSDSTWGMRKLAFEIRQRTEADYRFFRFVTGGSLLDDLNHNLKIADGVLRFRIFKVDPRSPVIVPPPPTPLSSGPTGRGPRRGDGPPRRGDGPRDRPPRDDHAADGSGAEQPAPPPPAPEAAEPAADAPAEPEATAATEAPPESGEAESEG